MWERYRRVWRAPHVPALVLASVLARVPTGIVSLALVLFVQDVKGSFAAAGAVTATFALSAALLAPMMGRLIDRRGQTRVLVAGIVVHASATLGLVALGLADAPLGAMIACAVAAGTTPPISSALRPLWAGLLRDDDLLTAAYALDAILLEAVFVAGPLVTGLVVALFSPQAALVLAAVLGVTGTLWFASLGPSREWRGEVAASRHLAGPLVSPGVRTIAAAALAIGVCFGALEVSLAAYATEREQPSLAGALIALQAVGSAIGGLWYGANHERLGPLARGYLVLVLAAPPLIALLAAAPTLGVLLPLAVLSGVVMAPIAAAENLLVGALAPAGTLTEAFTWVITAVVSGVACGNALAGVVVDAAGWRPALATACAIALGGGAIALARRRTLVPAG
ncbi:MAG TPA: MFS transporter [Capillimicrobium sp.]|nr:MFS transporter [Capillimicrobium sp.]